jgi:hypothetical protein
MCAVPLQKTLVAISSVLGGVSRGLACTQAVQRELLEAALQEMGVKPTKATMQLFRQQGGWKDQALQLHLRKVGHKRDEVVMAPVMKIASSTADEVPGSARPPSPQSAARAFIVSMQQQVKAGLPVSSSLGLDTFGAGMMHCAAATQIPRPRRRVHVVNSQHEGTATRPKQPVKCVASIDPCSRHCCNLHCKHGIASTQGTQLVEHVLDLASQASPCKQL